MIGELLSLAQFGHAAVSGVDALVTSLTRTGIHLALRGQALDREAAEDIVERARACVPQDTGRLFSGIEATEVGGVWGVQASAVNPRGRREMDYAFLDWDCPGLDTAGECSGSDSLTDEASEG